MLCSSGGKRKYQETNAFTAKAESGTLKVKIMRKDQRGVAVGLGSSFPSGFQQQQTQQSLSVTVQSPPKPRPNRKHVPIFYQSQHRSTSTSSTEGEVASSSVTSTSDLEQQPSSTTSDSGRFSALLSGLRLEGGIKNMSNSSTSVPTGNPLFVRTESDDIGSTFGDLLRASFPHNGIGGSTDLAGSSAYLHGETTGPATALHQLASSSATYGSESSIGPTSGAGTYHFDPLRALQSAIAAHQASTRTDSYVSPSQFAHQPLHLNHQHRSSDVQNADPDEAMDDASSSSMPMSTLGPPPGAPPSFMLQNSLMGGGIERQPDIANVNTHNFDWVKHLAAQGRPRSGSLPSIPTGLLGENAQNADATMSSAGDSASNSNSSHHHHLGPMWKEV